MTAVPATRPSRSTVTRSVIWRTSARSCDTNSTLEPRAAICRTKSNSSATSFCGRNTVGSSSTSSVGSSPLLRRSPSSARTMATSARSTGRIPSTVASGSIVTP